MPKISQKERCQKVHEIRIHQMQLRQVLEHLEKEKQELLKNCTHKLMFGDDAINSDGECGVCERKVRESK